MDFMAQRHFAEILILLCGAQFDLPRLLWKFCKERDHMGIRVKCWMLNYILAYHSILSNLKDLIVINELNGSVLSRDFKKAFVFDQNKRKHSRSNERLLQNMKWLYLWGKKWLEEVSLLAPASARVSSPVREGPAWFVRTTTSRAPRYAVWGNRQARLGRPSTSLNVN